MRRIGLTLAALLLVGVALVAGGRAQSPPSGHTCSATDRQFIATASLNLTSLGIWGEDYLNGDAKASQVVAEARNAAVRVGATSPSDPSLRKVRKLMDSMFSEYGKAILAQSRHRNAGMHMFRAYGLANFAHDLLVGVEPALRARGCDVSPLL